MPPAAARADRAECGRRGEAMCDPRAHGTRDPHRSGDHTRPAPRVLSAQSDLRGGVPARARSCGARGPGLVVAAFDGDLLVGLVRVLTDGLAASIVEFTRPGFQAVAKSAS